MERKKVEFNGIFYQINPRDHSLFCGRDKLILLGLATLLRLLVLLECFCGHMADLLRTDHGSESSRNTVRRQERSNSLARLKIMLMGHLELMR